MPETIRNAWTRAGKGGMRSPAVATALTVLLAVIGVVGSVFSSVLGRSFPLDLDTYFTTAPSGGWSWIATLFWPSLLGAGWLFYKRQRAVDKQRDQIDADLSAAVGTINASVGQIDAAVVRAEEALGQIDTKVAGITESEEILHRIVKTLAPAWSLGTFDQIYKECEGFAHLALNPPEWVKQVERDFVIGVVNVVLNGYLRLLRDAERPTWSQDPAATAPRYAANLMVYIQADDLSEEDWARLHAGHLKFWDHPRQNLRGVLDLRCDLSAVLAADAAASPDPGLPPFSLPVPTEPKPQLADGSAPWRVLPGAPMAFVAQERAHFGDASQMAHWCSEEGDFSRDVRAQVVDYFQDGETQAVRSLVAYPLTRNVFPSPPDQDAEPIGVLNIHSDHVGLLDGDRTGSFDITTYPLRLLLLLRLLERLVSFDEIGESGKWTLSRSD